MQSKLIHPFQWELFPSCSSAAGPCLSPAPFSSCWGVSRAEQRDRDFLCPAACAANTTSAFPFQDSSQILPKELQPHQLLLCHLHRWVFLQDFHTLHLLHHHIPSISPVWQDHLGLASHPSLQHNCCSHSQFAARRTKPPGLSFSRYSVFPAWKWLQSCLERVSLSPWVYPCHHQFTPTPDTSLCHFQPLISWRGRRLVGQDLALTKPF